MSTETNPQESAAGHKGNRPSHRAWLVVDSPTGEKPSWKELTGLWPTRKGDGLSGSVNAPLTLADGFLMGRLVVLPARLRPNRPEDEPGQGEAVEM